MCFNVQDNIISPTQPVKVTKKGPAAAVKANVNFDYTITVEANSPLVVVTDTIDASTGISFQSVSPATGGQWAYVCVQGTVRVCHKVCVCVGGEGQWSCVCVCMIVRARSSICVTVCM